ncbi:MAG: hypothetical protein EPO26_09720 [Chloroflexota bacterium]|nr:MAG: hypothetical protein EPO26_09720 [Chloroflexota bacterium]
MAFRPLGFMSPPIHVFPAKHSAFSMTRPDAKPVPRPVRSPGRMWVAEIWRAGFSSGGENFQVFTYPCRDVRVYWGHLTTVAPRLRDEFEKAPPVCNSFFEGTATVTTCRRSGLSIELSAGEEFGTGPDSAGIDFGVIDFRRAPAAFVRLDHYDSYYPYYASPLDYFTTDTRAKLERKTGNVFGNRARTAAPIGGTHMHDLPGTAVGNWFLPGKNFRTTTDLSGAIGLASDFADPTQPIIALGTSVRGARMGLYAFPPRETGTINRRFADVRADGRIYCYEGFSREQSPGGMPLTRPSGVLLLSLPTETTLRVEHVNQPACPPDSARAFGADAATFER